MHTQDAGRERALRGALWGTALGDALGLRYEGLSARDIARSIDPAAGLGLWGAHLFVSDDTEQTALVLESIVLARADLPAALRSFRSALRGWFLRLPFGIGLSTLRACLRMLFGSQAPGVASAGNGAAMRAGIIGVYFSSQREERRRFAEALARVTHTDVRAVEGAVYTAELAALCARPPTRDRAELVRLAARGIREPELRAGIDAALRLSGTQHHAELAPNTGYVVHTLALCTWAFIREGEHALSAIQAVIRAGGDTDTAAAIVGGWLGALHGPESLPAALLARLDDGPFGAQHLAALAHSSETEHVPAWSRLQALRRNLGLYPVVLAHGFLRLVRGQLRGRWA
ncbi:MAG TPA: ADP-ribosylglycohydrolase family protein [Polyangiaceae bacterium]|nr:ADP-ribosylglycohydrolase family protein [Polyangiaceae bacterium]